MQAHPQYARYTTYHTSKRQLLGNQAGHAAPAWRPNQAAQAKRPGVPANAVEKGSKILLSNLPLDVGESEVEVLFAKTVGPVKDAYIIYNSQARSKGMAVVTFQRPGDAAVARQKYNGKIVDGKRPIKIEIVTDEEIPIQTAPPTPQIPSLLQRLEAVAPPSKPAVVMPPAKPAAVMHPAKFAAVAATRPRAQNRPPQPPVPTSAAAMAAAAAARRPASNPKVKLRAKKGPKRIKKSLAQLDMEMEEYRAELEV